MKTRAEALRSRSSDNGTKTSAVERTIPIPFQHMLTCDACDEEFDSSTAKQRNDGTVECPECGNPCSTAQWPGVFPKDRPKAAQEPQKASKPKTETKVSNRPDTKDRATTDDIGYGHQPKPSKQSDTVDLGKAYRESQREVHTSTIRDTPEVTMGGNRISITWGEAKFPIDQYNGLKVGQVIVTVDHGPEDDRVELARKLLADMQRIQDLAFEVQAEWYQKKMKTWANIVKEKA